MLWEEGPGAVLELIQEQDGRWAWRYVNSSDDLVLDSNESFPTLEEARDSATTAYPDLPRMRVLPLSADGTGDQGDLVDVRAEATKLLGVLGAAAIVVLVWRMRRGR